MIMGIRRQGTLSQFLCLESPKTKIKVLARLSSHMETLGEAPLPRSSGLIDGRIPFLRFVGQRPLFPHSCQLGITFISYGPPIFLAM